MKYLGLPMRLVTLLCAIFCTLGLLSNGFAQSTELDRILVIVNDDVIVRSELETQLRLPPPSSSSTQTDLDDKERTRQVLEGLILVRLQLQVADQLGIAVSDSELNEAISKIAQRSNLGLSEFRDTLEREGYPFQAFRDNIRKEMLITRVRQRQIMGRIRVREHEIDDYLALPTNQPATEYRLSHILLALPEEEVSEKILLQKEKEARILIEKLENGEDFHQLARTVSDDEKARKGGDLGWRLEKDLPEIFRKSVVQLSVGEVSSLIRSARGLHLLLLTDKRGLKSVSKVVQTQARHILIHTNELVSDADAELRLERLRERIAQGEPFDDLARIHSDDRGSAIKDGQMGWLNPGDVVPSFEKVINALEINEISQPFHSRFGWHIVQVQARRNHDNSEQKRREKARKVLFERRATEEHQKWFAQLRNEAFIEYLVDDYAGVSP